MSGFCYPLVFLIFCLNEMLVAHIEIFVVFSAREKFEERENDVQIHCVIAGLAFFIVRRLVFRSKNKDSILVLFVRLEAEIQLPQFSFCRLFASNQWFFAVSI